MRRRVVVMGGTGIYDWGKGDRITLDVPAATVDASVHQGARTDVFFIPRHGPRHEVAAHAVNHAANAQAARALKPDYVWGLFNTGTVDPAVALGAWVVPADFIEPVAWSQPAGEEPLHRTSHEPYCPTLRRAVAGTGPRGVVEGGIYASLPGPRFETRQEAAWLRGLGASVVGMTGGGEATAMRTQGLCYAATCLVANEAGPSSQDASAVDIQAFMKRRVGVARSWLDRFERALPKTKRCGCAQLARAVALRLPKGRGVFA